MKFHIPRSMLVLTLGTTLAMLASESHAQTGGAPSGQFGFTGNSNTGSLFAPPTGGPGPGWANPTADSLPGNLGQPAIGGNTVKTLVGNAPAASPAVAPAVAPAAAPAAVATTTTVTATGGAAVAAVAAGLSTVNPVTILGNGLGGFPPGFNPSQFNQPNCRNVIDLLIRHCIGNRLFAVNGQPGFAPPFAAGGFAPPFFPPYFPGVVLGDLELVAVNVVTDGAPNIGPVYQVTFRSNSQFALQNFQISLVAVLGAINDFSPNVSVNVPLINAGETGNVQIQLPATVMAMGVPTQPLVPFDTLVVAIDSFDDVIESNELNNIATLKRVGIPVIVSTPAVTQTTTTVAPAATVPPAAAGPQPAPTAPAPGGADVQLAPPPSDSVVAKPQEKINLDSLDLGDNQAAAKPMAR